MEIKLARSAITQKPEKIALKDLDESLLQKSVKIAYLDRENSQKDLKELNSYYSKQGFMVYLREVRYGLDEKDIMFELHLV